MTIFRVNLTRMSTVSERAYIDIEGDNEKVVSAQALIASKTETLPWEIEYTQDSEMAQVEGVEVLAEGDEDVTESF